LASTILLAGYLGEGNLGDEAAMLGIVHGLRDFPYDFTALSGNPEETYRLYGIQAFPRRNDKYIEQAIEDCAALVFPGGSILQDTSSVGSVFYYQKLIARAKKAGKKVFMLGQGVGPLTTFLGRRAAISAFNAVDAISVRDPGATQTLKDLGYTKPIKLAADSAFLLPPPPPSDEAQGFNVGSMKTVGIAPRNVKGKGRDISGLFGEFCKLLYQSGSLPTLLTMDRAEDAPLIDEINKKQGGKIPDLRKLTTPMQVQQRMARMESVVAMRLHAGILAATVNVPALMINYDPKVQNYARIMELGNAVGLEGLTAPRLLDSFISFQKDHVRHVKILERKRIEQRDAAQASIELIRDFLKG
jgi:polysaccharide pyruvyl transferase CsaB